MKVPNEELVKRIVIKGARPDRRSKAAKEAERQRIKRRSRLDDMIFEKELGIFGELD